MSENIKVKIGDNTSADQMQLLFSVRNQRSNMFRMLGHVFTDNHILSGKEELHQDWIDIFKNHEDDFQDKLPPRAFDNYENYFKPLIPAISHHFSEIDPREQKIAFVLGAGISRPEPTNIPTVKELLSQLLDRAKQLHRKDLAELTKFCNDNKIKNIEDLLTAVHVATFCSRDSNVLNLINYLLYGSENENRDPRRNLSYNRNISRDSAVDISSVNFLQDTIQTLFGLLANSMLTEKYNKAHEAIAKYAKTQNSQRKNPPSIITTNYDCCIDLALKQQDIEQHVDIEYKVDFSNKPKPKNKRNKKPVLPLIKLHGSVNWYYCETCQTVQQTNISQMLDQYQNDYAPYTIIGICKRCGGQSKVLLVPPIATKFDFIPALTPLLQYTEKEFEKADIIVVVGFSFAEADMHISRMISKSMQINKDQKLIVADSVYSPVKRLINKFRNSITDFKKERILHLYGDCTDLLDNFLKGKYIEKAKEMKKKEN